MQVTPLSPLALKEKLQGESDIFLLDVREPHEFAYARIDHSVLIPLGQIPERIDDLDPDREIVVICHHGIRSQQAAMYLAHSGFARIFNLTGGIDAWSRLCDPSVLRY